MKLMMLGASGAQVQGINKAKALGCQVVTCDYTPEAVGHQLADEQCLTSTFDVEGVLEAAKAYKIDGIMTMGTDQPVYTCGLVSETLGLPGMLSTKVALSVTHKKVMKERFIEKQLPTVPYMIFGKEDVKEKLRDIEFPVVIKPVDSQGQRGIFFCNKPEEVIRHFEEVVSFSRETYMLVESYYPHDEVTVSGWVEEGHLYVMSITDRVTFDEKDQLGICLAHTFPSRHTALYKDEIVALSKQIVVDFEIMEGPIYFQLLIGSDGIKINEIACRIGGAYEGVYMPYVTGFDLCEAMVKKTMGQEVAIDALSTYQFPPKGKYLSVQLFFASACTVKSIPEIDTIEALDGVIECGFNYKIGDVIAGIDNATARAGYAIVEARSEALLWQRLDQLYEHLEVIGSDDRNHVIHEDYRRIPKINEGK